jgi:hypothetical protein
MGESPTFTTINLPSIMNIRQIVFPVLLVVSCLTFSTAMAQPRYSPGERARREVEWMTDSLHISKEQGEKINAISLKYNEEMDKAAQNKVKSKKQKAQKVLMARKDADVKKILNSKTSYKRYLVREKNLRALDAIEPKGRYQPY